MSKPEIDWDAVWHALNRSDQGDETGAGSAYKIITQLVDDAYAAGQRDTVMEGPARAAMLEAQAQWLDIATKAYGEVERVVAKTVALAFGEAAERLQPKTRPTLDPNVGLCGSSEAHDRHRFDEDYVDGKLVSWRTCQGISSS